MRLPIALAVLLAVLLAAPSRAAEDGDAAAGQAAAQRWCTSCHVVDAAAAGSDTAPPFRAIANNPVNTADGLRAFLSDPHDRMPKIGIPRQVIDDIIAYLQSLKE